MAETISLSEMEVGGVGRVVSVKASSSMRLHLFAMGIVRGVRIRVLKVAPLGDPIEIEVGKTRVSLRRDEAAAVILEPFKESGK